MVGCMGCDQIGQHIKVKTYTSLEKANASQNTKNLIWHYMLTFWEQVVAILPISILQILVLAIFFQQAPFDAGLQVMGLFCAMIGLVLFLDGLRVLTMPLAELIGQELPKKLPTWGVLIVAFCLGVLVTYAEPAIAALRPLAELVDPNEAPYLFYIMNLQTELLVLSIGVGVGFAAVVGTLRFLRDWSLKPLIYLSLAVTIGMSCYMQWGNPDLAPVIALAWDCGGITTGPVTVPILLALGIGVMRTQRQKRLATAALEGSVNANAGNALEGFGVVTLASLFPVFMVQVLAIIVSLVVPYDEALSQSQDTANQPTSSSLLDESPVKEIIFAIRSICPLILALFLTCWLVLRRKLPTISFWVPDDGTFEDPSVHGGKKKNKNKEKRSNLTQTASGIAKWEAEHDKGMNRVDSEASLDLSEMDTESASGSPHGANNFATTSSLKRVSTQGSLISVDEETIIGTGTPVSTPTTATAAAAATLPGTTDAVPVPSAMSKFKAAMHHYLPLILSCCTTLLGMMLFNIGLTYGFTALGNQTGRTLPAAYLEVPYDSRSPYYGYAGGLILVIFVTFFLGVLATRAEPALNVLGRTVEKLSGGNFSKSMLINAVATGVGVGMAVGGVKILYNLPIIYFILIKYAIAVGLTIVASEAMTAIAYDSAGVTTGPVTVPFVLSIGVGFAQAVNSSDGFGVLTVMSVSPIIAVLLTSLLNKPAKAARRELSKRARSLNRSFSRIGSRVNMKHNARALQISPSTAMAAFASGAGSSMPATPETSSHGGNLYTPTEPTITEEAVAAAVAASGNVAASQTPKGDEMA